MISRLKHCLYLSLLAVSGLLYGSTIWATEVTDIDFASLPGDQFEITLGFSEKPPEPKAYEIATPARLVLGFPGVQSALDKKKYTLSFENARNAVVVSDGARTRLILNLVEPVPFDTRIEGNSLVLRVGNDKGSRRKSSDLVAELSSSAVESGIDADFALTGIDFKRGPEGAGLITIDLSDPAVNVDIDKVGKKIRLEFYQTELPEQLDRRLDVVDFATPVEAIDSVQDGSTTVVVI